VSFFQFLSFDLISYLLPLLCLQSFADIAQAPTERLQALPGFGQVKVKRVKEAFEKPFRNNATSSTPDSFSQQQKQVPSDTPAQQDVV
jgi:DNA excision repair protein ERCC-1